MSDDRDESPVKPTVIDLDAEDVVTDEVKTEPVEEKPAPARHRSNLWWPGAALVLGLIAGGWLYRDVLSSYFPSGGLNDATARIATLEQQTRAIADQSAAAAARSADDVAKLTRQVDGSGKLMQRAQTTATEFGQRLSEMDARLKAITSDLGKLKSAPAAAPTPAGNGVTVDPEAVAALAQRVSDLEKEVASLKAGASPSGGGAQVAALSQALADLKAKIAAGLPYKDELGRVQRLAPAAAGLDVLDARANEGLPTAQGLADEMEGLISSLPKPDGAEAADGGYFDGFWRAVSGVITIRRIGEADWPGLAARVAAAARSGDLPSAIALIDKAEGAHPAALDQWRDRAKARLALEAALADTSQSVARQLSSMSSTP
jgi:hypothetical protein